MSRREAQRLVDIRGAIAALRDHVASDEFDQKTADAVLYNLVVIGEAARQISDETRAAAPEIPWAKVIALRNFIAHQYFRVDLEIIRDIVKQELDELDVVAARLIAEEGSEGT